MTSNLFLVPRGRFRRAKGASAWPLQIFTYIIIYMLLLLYTSCSMKISFNDV